MSQKLPMLCLVLVLAPSLAGASDVSQKYGVAQKGGSRDHGRHGCREERGTREARGLSNLPVAPVGPVVESLPLMNAVPSLMSMPMMLAARSAAVARESSGGECDHERVDELDARVEALHLRLMTIQRAVELQTQLLEELRVSGSIGGTRLPRTPTANAGN